MDEDLEAKCVIIGDGNVGKSSMISAFIKSEFLAEYKPTVFDTHQKTVVVDGRKIKISYLDTAGQECFSRVRTLNYSGTDVILLCFSVIDQKSMMNVRDRWHQEIKTYCSGVPILMIGLKIDARDDDRVLQELANKGEQPATPQDGRKIAKILNAEYMECSSFSRKGVKEVFEAVQKIVIESKNKQSEAEGKPKKKCLVM